VLAFHLSVRLHFGNQWSVLAKNNLEWAVKTKAPPSGPVETSVTITGTGLTQTAKMTFDGVAATSFTVNSDTQVTADVPTGAKTSKVAVTPRTAAPAVRRNSG
jgi:hypothetical protein